MSLARRFRYFGIRSPSVTTAVRAAAAALAAATTSVPACAWTRIFVASLRAVSRLPLETRPSDLRRCWLPTLNLSRAAAPARFVFWGAFPAILATAKVRQFVIEHLHVPFAGRHFQLRGKAFPKFHCFLSPSRNVSGPQSPLRRTKCC